MDRPDDRPRLRLAARTFVLAAAVWAGFIAARGVPAAPAQSSGRPAGNGTETSPAETRSPPGRGPAEGPADSTARIDGFWGLAWGADSAAVAERLGPPITIGGQDDGLRFFVYTPLYLGRDGFLQMWLHGEEGLVGASWEPMTSDCSDMLRRLVRATRREHRAVPSRTEGRMTPAMLGGDLCMAALEKGASVTVVWEDTAGTEIRIGTSPGSHKLRLRVLTAPLLRRRPGGI